MSKRFFADCKKHLRSMNVDIIFDVGASEGEMTSELLQNFPDSKIVAFEPVKASFAAFNEKFSSYPNVITNRMALGSHCTVGTVTPGGVTELAGSDDETPAPRSERPDSVEICTGDVYCERAEIGRISLLNVDTDGHDLEVLRGFHKMIGEQQIDVVYVGVGMNAQSKRHVSFDVVRGYLEACDYSLFGIYGQRRDGKGRPILRRCDLVFVSRRIVDANTAGRRPSQ